MKESTLLYGLIECRTSCDNCGGAIHIDGPVESKTCIRCGTKKDIPRGVIIDLIETLFTDWLENDWGPLEATTASAFSSINYEFSVGRQTPCCRMCKEYFSKADIQNPSHGENSEMICMKCGTVMSVNRPPFWLKEKFGGIEYVYNAQLDDFQPKIITEKPAISNVVYPCPKCNNPLDIDGTERLVHCSYCDHNIYLPDDLWQKLFPPKESQLDSRWYIGFRELPIPPEKQREMLETQLAKLECKIVEYESEIHSLRKQYRDKRARLSRRAEIIEQIEILLAKKETLKLELVSIEDE